ncbi:serine/threonine-protein kinase gad8 [Zymoseptoria brevis]|uniref:non-specific serine/threonine protein kinase n=1 Tax=Zymoseptoria brevis TaxID=1047168 RepID=A0A0F4GFU2_9PEZI|nr:serine/threonine-protein kinase gad8 [Zymoseptoria brevis]
MSWKLTKKLKETHLGAPFSNTFSRSSSQSAINNTTPADGSKTASTNPTPATSSAASTISNASDPQGIAASEQLATATATPAKPGILILTLHEGKGFSLPPGAEQAFARPGHGSSMSAGSFSSSYMGSGNSARPGSSSVNQGSFRPMSSSGGGINNMPSTHGRYSSKYLPYALVDFDKQQVFVNSVSGTPENPLWAGESTQYKFDVSRSTELNISLYIRNPTAPPNAGRQQDIFIGTCRVKPTFDEDVPQSAEAPDAKKDKKEKSMPPPQANNGLGIQWNEIQYGSGSIKLGVKFVENTQRSLKVEDFELLKVVGKGSFGKVMQVMKKDTSRIYALKTIRKQHIISRSEVAHTLAERSVLAQINNPFIAPLKFSFQSPDKLYLVLAFVNGGELFYHLQKEQRFDINRSRFYAAELLCALECLHGFGVIYRDLKPENILVDYVGHIALCDFGLCKLDMKDEDKTNTFCGTPEYLAPELLHGQGYTKAVDWWTLGVLLYEMLTGLPPFYDENTNEMYRKILSEPLHFPGPEVVPPAARDLLTKLLDRDATRRLGTNGAAEIKAHPFFHSIDWRKLLDRKYEPSFKPSVVDERDTANFDKEFTSEAPADSYVEGPVLSQTMQQQFQGWSYNRPVEGLGDAGGSIVQGSGFDQQR